MGSACPVEGGIIAQEGERVTVKVGRDGSSLTLPAISVENGSREVIILCQIEQVGLCYSGNPLDPDALPEADSSEAHGRRVLQGHPGPGVDGLAIEE